MILVQVAIVLNPHCQLQPFARTQKLTTPKKHFAHHNIHHTTQGFPLFNFHDPGRNYIVISLVFGGACFGKCFSIPIVFGPWAPGTKGPLGVNSLSSFPGIHLSHTCCVFDQGFWCVEMAYLSSFWRRSIFRKHTLNQKCHNLLCHFVVLNQWKI